MVHSNSTTRFLNINEVILTQTDTTVGFLSQDGARLASVKSRDIHKPFIKVFPNFKNFHRSGMRIPQCHKRVVRRLQKSTFIIGENSFRISPSSLHSAILRKMEWSYSTSANESGKDFEREFCEEVADIVIEGREGLSQKSASNIYKISRTKRVKIR